MSDDSKPVKPAIVLKLSSDLILERGQPFLNEVASLIAENRERYHFVIVSSGAIGLGQKKENLDERPTSNAELQRLASIGQLELMKLWEKAFESTGQKITVAQQLFTHGDLNNPNRNAIIAEQFDHHFEKGSIPIINENDTVSAREISFGDNDQLAARVALMLGAQKLVLLTHNVPGLLDMTGKKFDADGKILDAEGKECDPESLVISDLNGVPDEIYENLSQRVGSRNKGGMSSKLLAAKIAAVATEVSTAHIMGGKQLTQKLSKLLRGVGFAAGTTIRAGKDKKAFLGVLTKSLGMAYQMCKNVQTIGRQSHWGTDRVFEQPAS